MLPGGTDPGYRALLATPHHPTWRVEVWRSGVRIDSGGDEGLPIHSGTISATLASQVSRSMNISVNEALYPVSDFDMLAPYGSELRVYQGIKPGAGVPYEWQTFRGKIQNVELSDSGETLIYATDRAGEVKESGFFRPDNSRTGYPVIDEFRRLIFDGVPDATFGTSDPITYLTPTLTWEEDRGSALDDLASGANGFWYALANGDYVIRTVPWTINQTPVIDLKDGDGGTLTSAIPSKSRENVYNTIVVIGERADGTAPIYAVAQDLDPSSPTYVNGGFGIKTLLVRTQSIGEQSQAIAVARAVLRYSKALTQSWILQSTTDPALELGDCIGITARGLTRDIQVVDSFSVSILGDQAMSITTRALRPGTTGGQ